MRDIDLCDLDRFANGFPHDTFRRLRDEAPVWWHPATAHTPDEEGFWVLSRYSDIAAAASDAETFSSETGGRRSGGGTLIEDLPAGFAVGVLLNMTDDPRHLDMRRQCLPRVSPAALRAAEADLRARALRIVDDAVDAGDVDFLRDVAAELPLQAVASLLGVPQTDRHRLFEWANATLDYDGRNLGESSEASAAAAAEMFQYGQQLLADKVASPGDDLLSDLVTAEVPLSPDEQQMFFNLMIAAGSETTRNSLAIGVMALASDPDSWTAVRDDRSLVPSATEEILRWASSTTYNRRTATRDVDIADATIRAGDKVTLWWASANHDPRAFPNPERFDVRRSPNRHLAFGHGPHVCLGGHLARLEIRIVLDAVLDRIEMIEPTGPVEWVRSNKHTGVRRMPVRIHPRRT